MVDGIVKHSSPMTSTPDVTSRADTSFIKSVQPGRSQDRKYSRPTYRKSSPGSVQRSDGRAADDGAAQYDDTSHCELIGCTPRRQTDSRDRCRISTEPNKKHLKNVGPIRHNEPPHAHSPDVASNTVARRLRIDVHDNDNDNA